MSSVLCIFDASALCIFSVQYPSAVWRTPKVHCKKEDDDAHSVLCSLFFASSMHSRMGPTPLVKKMHPLFYIFFTCTCGACVYNLRTLLHQRCVHLRCIPLFHLRWCACVRRALHLIESAFSEGVGDSLQRMRPLQRRFDQMHTHVTSPM